MTSDYASMPPRPIAAEAQAILACLADSLGYRYFWATADLPEETLTFAPPGGAMTLGALLGHMRDLAWKIDLSLSGPGGDRSGSTLAEMRDSTLVWIRASAGRLTGMSAAEIEAVEITSSRGDNGNLWTLIHGPMADFLTHVGQVNSWRRMAGSPPPKARVFHGLPPEDSPASS